MTDETITLDPVEFVPERTELGLDLMGIRVREADWGDSEHEMFMVRQALGEIPADRHPPNRTPTFKLRIEEDGPLSLAEAAHRLQQKVGLWQREGGFVRRDLDSNSGFEGPVATRVHTAALSGIHGWMMAHRKRIPEVTLALTTDPYFYGVSEIALNEVKAENVRRLEYEIKEAKGSAPGLIRVLVKNEGTNKWYGLIHSMESRYSSGDATAKMFYEAEALTLEGKAVKGARTGASGEVVKSGSLSNSWAKILSSKIGVNHMTHVGNRRVLLRIYDPNTSAGLVKLRLEWKSLGSNTWTQNSIVKTPLAGGFSIVDMGEVIPAEAVLGTQRWEWRLTAKTEGSIGQEVEVDCVYIFATEQHIKMRETVVAPLGGIVWEDHFEQTEGAATGKSAPIGGVYTGAGDADDFTVVDAEDRLKRVAISDTSVNNGRYLLSGAAESEEITYKLTVRRFGGGTGSGVRMGQILRYKDTSNWLRVAYEPAVKVVSGSPMEGAYLKIEKCVAGVVTLLKTSEFISSGSFVREITTTVQKTGKITVIASESKFSTTELVVTDEVFAEGKTLAKGKVGIYDANTTTVVGTRQYMNPVLEAVASEDGLVYPGRSLEIRSDGVHRQHLTDDVWSRLTPDGFLPYMPPAGLEGRVARGIVVPSSGDLGNVEDAGSHKLSVKVMYFPGYHFVSEGV